MKKLEIYKENECLMSTLVNDYDINTYEHCVDIATKNDDIDITYSIPVNKGYKIIVEI